MVENCDRLVKIQVGMENSRCLIVSKIDRQTERRIKRTKCPWVGSTRGLGWVSLDQDFAVFDGLGWFGSNMTTDYF